MKNIGSLFKTIKENLSNPKTKSLTLLGLYTLFFIFIAVIFRQSGAVSTNEVNDSQLQEETGVYSYEYNYSFNINNELTNILGTHYKEKDSFNINESKYYKENDNIIDVNNPNAIIELVFNIDNYSYSNIEKLIQSSSFKEKTTYNDGSSKTIYQINILDLNIIDYCLNNECSEQLIEYTVLEDEYINSVTIDLTNYYGYNYIITLNYNNINNVSDIKISTITE